MTKQQARKLITMEARSFKRMGADSKQFLRALASEEYKIQIHDDPNKASLYEAYLLIEDEMKHIIPLIWNGKHR